MLISEERFLFNDIKRNVSNDLAMHRKGEENILFIIVNLVKYKPIKILYVDGKIVQFILSDFIINCYIM